MKKVISIILAMAMVISIAACGSTGSQGNTQPAQPETESQPIQTTVSDGPSQAEESESQNEDPTEEETEDPYADVEKTIVVGITGDVGSFYPWGGFSVGVKYIFPFIYQTLLSDVRDPETGNIERYHTIMDTYEKTGDTTYVVKIREGIYDTAGNPFTAEDVCFNFDMFKAGTAGATLANFVDYHAADDLTVEITVAEELGVGEFEEMLSTPNMVTRAAFEASPDEMQTTPVGTTGYYVDEYVPNSRVIIKKADSYWNQTANETKAIDDGYLPTSDNTRIDVADFEVITDVNSMAMALETNAIDIATSVAVNDVEFYEDGSMGDNISLFALEDNMLGLVFNSGSKSEFKNENLRKAVAYSVSADDLLGALYNGRGFKLKAFGMSYQMGYDHEWDNQPYFEKDMSKAKQYFDDYLKECGKNASDLKFKIISNSTDAMAKYAQVVQAAMIELTGNANICEIITYDSATYGTIMNNPENFDLAVLSTLSNKAYVLYNWQKNYNGYIRVTGDDASFSGDTKLWDLQLAAQTEETFGTEASDAFQEYMNEKCYFVDYICGPAYWAGSNLVKTWAIGAKNSVAITAMTYDWSVKY